MGTSGNEHGAQIRKAQTCWHQSESRRAVPARQYLVLVVLHLIAIDHHHFYRILLVLKSLHGVPTTVAQTLPQRTKYSSSESRLLCHLTLVAGSGAMDPVFEKLTKEIEDAGKEVKMP
ncbi:hypothetical protein COCOBI_12-1060 [Coccomyxa sp. Obi]|nr:hypothetical protein COCOBI_12-1060 [Coccomyxa sp. Obi]